MGAKIEERGLGNPKRGVVEPGNKIVAVIRHCNPLLKEPDQTLTLTAADDGFYIDEGPDELSYNWDIVSWVRAGRSKRGK